MIYSSQGETDRNDKDVLFLMKHERSIYFDNKPSLFSILRPMIKTAGTDEVCHLHIIGEIYCILNDLADSSAPGSCLTGKNIIHVEQIL